MQEICFEPVLPLVNTATRDFAFYDSASVKVIGSFNGSQQTLELTPLVESPNCFSGPTDQIAAKGASYSLDATIRWDSSGTRVTTHLTATTSTPIHMALQGGMALPLGNLGKVIDDPIIYPMLKNALGDTVDYLRANEAARDTFQGMNEAAIFGMLGDYKVPFANGDTLRYMNPPFDLQSHLLVTDYSADVQGMLLTMRFDSTSGKGASSFDNFFGGNVDTTRKWESEFRHRIYFLQYQKSPSGNGNILDSLGLSNVYFYFGKNMFYVYATGIDYVNYINSSVSGAGDSRIRPVTNITGGLGIFAGMTVDSIELYVKPLPNTRIYSYPANRVAACELENYWVSEEECRNYIPTHCADSIESKPACAPYEVKLALDSALAWNALYPTADDSAKAQGERMWCRSQDYPASTICDVPRQESLESREATGAMLEQIDFCADRGWPIESYQSCGTTLVAWMRIFDKKSTTLERVRNEWCDSHPADIQCK